MYMHHDARNYPPLACNKLNNVLRAFTSYKNEVAKCGSKQTEEIATCYLIGDLENALSCYIYESN